MRLKVLASVAIVGLLAVPALPAGAQAVGDADAAVRRAAQEVLDARDRADAAAGRWARAETAHQALLDEIDRLQADRDQAAQQLGALRGTVQGVALRRYVVGSAGPSLFGADTDSLTEQVQADALLRFFTDGSNAAIDDAKALTEDLAYRDKVLAAKRTKAEKALAALEASKVSLDAEVARLQQVEQQRMQDARVARIVAAQSEQRRAAEAATQAAAQAAADAEAARQQQADAAAQQQASAAPGRAASAGRVAAVAPGKAAAVPSAKVAAARPVADASGADGASADGGAAAPPSRAAAPAASSGGGMQCPVAGPSAFVDTYGAPRSGGRRHQGVDMISPRGTPVVAVRDGVASSQQNRLGGNAAYLHADNGDVFYYAHLDSYGQLGSVTAGTVIGYVGDTGDARGTPHLHFEIHPGGGSPIDPYPRTRAAC